MPSLSASCTTCQPIFHKYPLIALWTIHLSILIPPFVEQLVTQLLYLTRHPSAWSYSWLIDDLATFACLVLEGVEIGRWRGGRLTAGFYLVSNAWKVVYWSWALGWLVWTRARVGFGAWYVWAGALQLVTFLLGFGYALFVWVRQRRRRASFSRGSDGVIDDALLSPDRLNAATAIQSDCPVVIRLAIWVKEDPRWLRRFPPGARTTLSPCLWVMRYAICFLPINGLLPFTGRMPGEPKNQFNDGTNPEMDNWEYLKPTVTPKETFRDELPNPRLPPALPHDDEEAALDTLSLRTINGNIPRRLSPRPTGQRTMERSPSRLLGPRYLCFITEDTDVPHGYVTKHVEDWMSQTQTRNEPDYIFISYTRQQFYSQIPNDPTITQDDLVHRRAAADRDQAILTGFAVKATRDAGVPAFWIDFECVQPEDDDEQEADMEDVYRICDIVRASHSLVIISGPTLDQNLDRASGEASTPADWLLDWGKRLWTLPEALLCPSEHRISIYAVGREEPERIAKRNLPSRLWDDAAIIRQLIDHYEASLQLTQLELISIALDCLQRRQTEQRNAGDVVYALMGLLRIRPKVNKSDTAFQAFARLSLANDSDKILERLICLHNPTTSARWHDMHDSWNARLWHVDPVFRIADIGIHNSIIIGDAVGATIDWTSLKMIDFTGSSSRYSFRWRYIRVVTAFILAYLGIYLVFFSIFAPIQNSRPRWELDGKPWRPDGKQSSTNPTRTALIGLTFTWIVWAVAGLWVPYMLGGLLKGEVTATQARIFGIAGVPDINLVERYVLGEACGRLRWNVAGGSRSTTDTRPMFTLIDTFSLTLTTFRAKSAPTMLFAGGPDRGMLRLLLCSYDGVRGAFVKETVVQMEGSVNTRMPRLGKFCFEVGVDGVDEVGGGRGEGYVDEDEEAEDDGDTMQLPDIPEFRSLD